jgi:hypothetical protein
MFLTSWEKEMRKYEFVRNRFTIRIAFLLLVILLGAPNLLWTRTSSLPNSDVSRCETVGDLFNGWGSSEGVLHFSEDPSSAEYLLAGKVRAAFISKKNYLYLASLVHSSSKRQNSFILNRIDQKTGVTDANFSLTTRKGTEVRRHRVPIVSGNGTSILRSKIEVDGIFVEESGTTAPEIMVFGRQYRWQRSSQGRILRSFVHFLWTSATQRTTFLSKATPAPGRKGVLPQTKIFFAPSTNSTSKYLSIRKRSSSGLVNSQEFSLTISELRKKELYVLKRTSFIAPNNFNVRGVTQALDGGWYIFGVIKNLSNEGLSAAVIKLYGDGRQDKNFGVSSGAALTLQEQEVVPLSVITSEISQQPIESLLAFDRKDGGLVLFDLTKGERIIRFMISSRISSTKIAKRTAPIVAGRPTGNVVALLWENDSSSERSASFHCISESDESLPNTPGLDGAETPTIVDPNTPTPTPAFTGTAIPTLSATSTNSPSPTKGSSDNPPNPSDPPPSTTPIPAATLTPTFTATSTATNTATVTPTATSTPVIHSVEQYAVLELVFQSAKDYSNPGSLTTIPDPFEYDQNQVYLTLYAPGSTAPVKRDDGSDARFLGFWNGGKEWRVRFSPQHLGTGWRYTLHNTMGDESLQNITGTINVVPPSGKSLTAQHGGILNIDANTKKLAYTDKTPFFWMADRWNRFPKGFDKLVSDPKSTPIPGSEQPKIPFIDAITKARQEMGFTAIQAHGWHISLPLTVNGRSTRISALNSIEDRSGASLEYWRYFDGRLRKLTDAGLVVFLGYGSEYWIDRLIEEDSTTTPPKKSKKKAFKQMFQYSLARYGAYPISYMITQEYNNYNYIDYVTDTRRPYDQKVLHEREDLLNTVGTSLKHLDPYGRAITIHMATWGNSLKEDRTTLYNPAESWPWISFYLMQSGHRVGFPSRGSTQGIPFYTSALYDRFFNQEMNKKSLYTKPWVDGETNWDQMVRAFNYSLPNDSPLPPTQGTPTSLITAFQCPSESVPTPGVTPSPTATPWVKGWADISIGSNIVGESNTVAMQSGAMGLSYGALGLFGSFESPTQYPNNVNAWGPCKTMYDALDFPAPRALKILKDAYEKNLEWWRLVPKTSFHLLHAKLANLPSPLNPPITVGSPTSQGYRGDDEGYRLSVPGGWGSINANQKVMVEKPGVRYRVTVYRQEVDARGTAIPGYPVSFLASTPRVSTTAAPNVTPFIMLPCDLNYSCTPTHTPTATPTTTATRTPTNTPTARPGQTIIPVPTPTVTATPTITPTPVPTVTPIPSTIPLVIEVKRDDYSVTGHSTEGKEEYMVHFPSITTRGGVVPVKVEMATTSYVYYGISPRTGDCWTGSVPKEVLSDHNRILTIPRPPISQAHVDFLLVIKKGTLVDIGDRCPN